jgi:hypothetical protein
MQELEFLDHLRNPYVWPGGYAKVFLMADCEPVCMECATRERALILRSMAYKDRQWTPEYVYVNWESEECCAHCSKPIPPEYDLIDYAREV